MFLLEQLEEKKNKKNRKKYQKENVNWFWSYKYIHYFFRLFVSLVAGRLSACSKRFSPFHPIFSFDIYNWTAGDQFSRILAHKFTCRWQSLVLYIIHICGTHEFAPDLSIMQTANLRTHYQSSIDWTFDDTLMIVRRWQTFPIRPREKKRWRKGCSSFVTSVPWHVESSNGRIDLKESENMKTKINAKRTKNINDKWMKQIKLIWQMFDIVRLLTFFLFFSFCANFSFYV